MDPMTMMLLAGGTGGAAQHLGSILGFEAFGGGGDFDEAMRRLQENQIIADARSREGLGRIELSGRKSISRLERSLGNIERQFASSAALASEAGRNAARTARESGEQRRSSASAQLSSRGFGQSSAGLSLLSGIDTQTDRAVADTMLASAGQVEGIKLQGEQTVADINRAIAEFQANQGRAEAGQLNFMAGMLEGREVPVDPDGRIRQGFYQNTLSGLFGGQAQNASMLGLMGLSGNV